MPVLLVSRDQTYLQSKYLMIDVIINEILLIWNHKKTLLIRLIDVFDISWCELMNNLIFVCFLAKAGMFDYYSVNTIFEGFGV